MYERLAGPERAGVPWPRLHVLWGDERCVPPDDPRSNYRMALESGLLAVPPAGIHRMPGELPPEEGAFRYEQELRALFPEDGFPRLDLVSPGAGGGWARGLARPRVGGPAGARAAGSPRPSRTRGPGA